jgi:hypothetical protein
VPDEHDDAAIVRAPVRFYGEKPHEPLVVAPIGLRLADKTSGVYARLAADFIATLLAFLKQG